MNDTTESREITAPRRCIEVSVLGLEEVKRTLQQADETIDELQARVDDMADECNQLQAATRAIADWLCQVGYPIDFRTDALPPESFRAHIEEAWVRADGASPAVDIRNMVADEGGWS